MKNQKTIMTPVSLSGIGLFTGIKSNMRLLPAASNHGIVFQRVDLPNKPKISVSIKNISNTSFHCSCIEENNAKVLTTEHFLAALHCLDISNLLVEIDSEELPIMNGASDVFLLALKSGGVVVQNEPQKQLFVSKNLEIMLNNQSIQVYPSNTLEIEYYLSDTEIVKNTECFVFNELKTSFYTGIAKAKTFSSRKKIDYMIQNNIFPKGGTVKNALIYNNCDIENAEMVSYPNEAIRHKILDFIGDSMLSGFFIKGRFVCHNSGHELNRQIIAKIASSEISA